MNKYICRLLGLLTAIAFVCVLSQLTSARASDEDTNEPAEGENAESVLEELEADDLPSDFTEVGTGAARAYDVTSAPLIPGDRVRVIMREDPEVEYAGEISAAGTIPIPYLGEFSIAGYTPKDAAEALREELTEDLYNQATVNVTLIEKGLGRVYVYGAVREPGMVQIPDVGGMTVLQLITQIGGLSRWADPDGAFLLRRTHPEEPHQRIELELGELFGADVPDTEKDVLLQPNDIVCIPGVTGGLFDFLSVEDAEVYVVGEVNAQETMVYFAPGERRTLLRAILKAGGLSRYARGSQVRVVRFTEGEGREEFTVDVAAIIEDGELDRDMELKQGDMVIVPQRRVTF